LIIRLIIQTIRRDPSGSDQIDEASYVSRLDPSGADQIDAEHQSTDLAARSVDTAYMHRRPFTASASLVGRVTLTLYGPIGELAAALRTLADALDQEQATSTVTYIATVEPQARGPAPGGMTASLADRFVAQLTPAAVEVLGDPVPSCPRGDLRGAPS
jgi:hypothetical protein